MNTKQEIIDAIEGTFIGELPPPVLFTQTGTLDQMKHCGVFWPDAHRDAKLMVKLALQPSERFGFATARVPFDVSAEAEAIGCFVNTGTDINQPAVTGSPWREYMTVPPVSELPSVDDFLSGQRIRTIIDSAKRLCDKGDLFVTSMCVSSSSIAMHMMGMENMIMCTVADLDAVTGLVDFVTPYSVAYAEELSKASDNVMVITSALAGIMTPEFVEETLKRDGMIVDAIKDSFSTVHNCGNTFEYVDDLVSMDPDILSLETSSKPETYMRKVGKRCRMLGCINPITVLLPGSPESVKQEALRSAELGFSLVGPECGVPPLTPDANLMALAGYRS